MHLYRVAGRQDDTLTEGPGAQGRRACFEVGMLANAFVDIVLCILVAATSQEHGTICRFVR